MYATHRCVGFLVEEEFLRDHYALCTIANDRQAGLIRVYHISHTLFENNDKILSMLNTSVYAQHKVQKKHI